MWVDCHLFFCRLWPSLADQRPRKSCDQVLACNQINRGLCSREARQAKAREMQAECRGVRPVVILTSDLSHFDLAIRAD